MGHEAHVGQGTSAGALTVFPVWNESGGSRRYTTGGESLVVGEQGGGSVSHLLAHNPGGLDALVLEGQLFEGGLQHRMATRSVVVPARSQAALEVACVEQGRWSGSVGQGSRGRRATPFVRSGVRGDLAGREGQSEVWRRVGTYDTGVDAAGTGSLIGHVDRAGAEVERLVRRLRPVPGQAGVLVGLGGQPLMLEVFDDPRTLAEQFASIVRAAGLDAIGRLAVPTPGRRARRLVERLELVGPDEVLREGRSTYARATTDRLDVAVLRHHRRTVHLRATYRRNPLLVAA